MWKILAAAVLLTGLVGCGTLRDHQMNRSMVRSREAALAKIDPEECRAKNSFKPKPLRGSAQFRR
jgi:hypothetical protein